MTVAPATHEWAVALADEEATAALAGEIATALKPGDLVTLSGGLGVGKTAFARALIRAMTGDPSLEVVSPTFSLVQVYEGSTAPIVHADLYRLSGPEDLVEIGWEETAEGAVVMIEWPERIAAHLPPDRLDVHLDLALDKSLTARTALLVGHGAWAARLPRIAAIGAFLRDTRWDRARRDYMVGDASTRLYERLSLNGETAILMNAPRRPPGQPVKYGRSYAEIAHLADSVVPFVALAKGLQHLGLSAPAILGADLEAGLLLIEDFGNLGVVDKDGPIADRYAAAIDVLVALHAADPPFRLPVAPGIEHDIPPFDRPAMEIEIEQLLDWYFPQAGLGAVSQRIRDGFFAAWREPFDTILGGPKTWLLRDFHSPNLMWLPGRMGVGRVGLLDFQDAMIGSPAYDVASLAMDARVTVPEDLELHLIGRYVHGRRRADPTFDVAGFARDYAIMGAQRLTKILGIFARLNLRDGKPQYLRHMPRIRAYLGRALAHPSLAAVRAWYETHVFRDDDKGHEGGV